MSRDRHSDQPISAEELRLVEALYGESPATEVGQADELAGLQDLRAMFAELPDEEPPSAISAKLMSAAAEAVKARAPEKPGLWARLLALFEPIGAHPALAAAASLVLVVAIGGVMVMSGRSKVSEPSRESSPAHLAGDKAKAEDSTLEKKELPALSAPESALPAKVDQEEEVAKSTGASVRQNKKPKPKPDPKPATIPPPPPRNQQDKGKGSGDGPVTGVADGRTGIGFDVNDDDTEPDPEPDTNESKNDRRTTATALERQRSTKIAAEVERLTSTARKAAAKRDCTEVRNTTAQVRKLDPNAYKALAKEAKIRNCLAVKVRKGKK